MTKEHVKDVLNRVSTWPQERQEELAEIALAIEAGMRGEYHATPEELEAIDEGLQGEAASDEEVEAAFATFRRDENRVLEASDRRSVRDCRLLS